MQLLSNTTSPYGRIARVAMIEKDLDVEPTIIDPWSDEARLREANAATRVPTLILDDGTPLAESLLIVQWLEHTRPEPGLIGPDAAGVVSRAGIAFGVIEAAVATLICRKISAPALFDETPIGLRRQRTMAEGMQRLEKAAAARPLYRGEGTPTLDAIGAVVALDYLRFRFADARWMPELPALDALSKQARRRASFERTLPR